MEIPLHTHETFLKYIGGLHSYLLHTIMMFNPPNIDEVLVQATHVESRKGKHGTENAYKKPSKFEKHSKGKEKVQEDNYIEEISGEAYMSSLR